MRIVVEEDATLAEAEVTFRVPRISSTVMDAVASLRLRDQKLTGYADEATHIVNAAEVLYFESVDKRTFFYTRNDVLETSMRLYEIEDKLSTCGFIRVSKSFIVNLKEVATLKADISGKMLATLSNGEHIVISRAYSPAVRHALGL